LPKLNDDKQNSLVQLIDKSLGMVGVKVMVDQGTPLYYEHQVEAEHSYDMALRTEVFQMNFDIYPLFHSSEAVANGKNFSNFANADVDEALNAALSSNDPNVILNKKRLVHRLIHDEVPAFFLWTHTNYAARRVELRHVRIHPFYFFSTVEDWDIR
jgi:ABC-type transport system substrate-binding protein